MSGFPLTAKVASVLDSRTVALNIGKKKGVKQGMIFKLYSSGEIVKDPDTGLELGTIKIARYSVRVTTVEDLYSVASTYEFRTVNKGGIGLGLGSASTIGKTFEAPRYVKEYVNFEITDEDAKKIKKERSVIKVGDIAEQVIEASSSD